MALGFYSAAIGPHGICKFTSTSVSGSQPKTRSLVEPQGIPGLSQVIDIEDSLLGTHVCTPEAS